MTTTPYQGWDQFTHTSDTEVSYIDLPINKPAFIGCFVTFLVLASLLNVFVIACIIYLYVRRPETRMGFPKLLIMLVCCLLHLCEAWGPWAVGLHFHNVFRTDSEMSLTCQEIQALELSAFMINTVVTLLVAAVLLQEALTLQAFVTLIPRIQIVVALGLVVFSCVYGFVAIIPAFYFSWLRDHSQPCYKNTDKLDIASNVKTLEAMPVVYFILPHCLVFMSCLLLLMAFFTRRCGSRQGGSAQHNRPPPLSVLQSGTAAGDVQNTTNLPHTGTSPQNDPSLHTTAQRPPHMESTDSPSFPFNLLLAGAVSFTFEFVAFFRMFVAPLELEMTYKERTRLWAAGLLLSVLTGIFLPCCWLLDGVLRTVWCRCCCRGPRTSGQTSVSSPEEGEQREIMALV